ncbi:MAG: glycosyltransferase family 9 protein [Halieaceae bacterium]|nr:glycosyltransferase family 9 protein [Halieaceae bacterium]
MQDKPKTICILRLSAIGDVCHAVATVQAIQRHLPETRVIWVIGSIEAGLIGDLPGIDFIIFDKRAGWRELLRVRRQFTDAVDVLLHMQVALRANMLAAVIPAKRRLGFPPHLAKELHSLVVGEAVRLPERPHVLEGFQAFAYALGVPRFKPAWCIPVSDADQDWARAQVADQRPTLLISPAASKPERCWTVEGYAAMAEHAVAAGYRILVTSGPASWEQRLAAEIVNSSRAPIINLAGKTSLKQLLALMAEVQIVLAPDSGPAHMAVTQGVPVIGLYAHSNPARTGPYSCLDYVVETYHQNIEQQYGKPSSQLPWGKRAKGESLMQGISINAVRAEFDRLSEMIGPS